MKMKTRLNSHDEDAASGALAQIFWQDNDALALFLNLIGVDNTQLESNWKISAQYPTKTGRSMDIFLRNGSTSIVVEAKIGDVIKHGSRCPSRLARIEIFERHCRYVKDEDSSLPGTRASYRGKTGAGTRI